MSRSFLIFVNATVHILHTVHSTALYCEYNRLSSCCDEALGLNSDGTGFVSRQCHPLSFYFVSRWRTVWFLEQATTYFLQRFSNLHPPAVIREVKYIQSEHNNLSYQINYIFRPIYNHHQADYKTEKEIFSCKGLVSRNSHVYCYIKLHDNDMLTWN